VQEDKTLAVNSQPTAPARHTNSKASRTRITVSTAGEWRDPLFAMRFGFEGSKN